jgi:hypothetical protein
VQLNNNVRRRTRIVKSIYSFFPKRNRKPNQTLERIVTSKAALMISSVVFVAALWPVLTLRIGRPTSWFGDLLLVLSAGFSVFIAPALCVATFMDIVRRRADALLFVAFLLSLTGVLAVIAFFYLVIHPV